MSELKERKFVECFKSNREGSCNYCRTRAWNVGNKIFAMKIPETGHWVACTDKKCYLEQGGKLTLFETPPQTPKEPTKSTVTEEETACSEFHNYCRNNGVPVTAESLAYIWNTVYIQRCNK